MNTFQKMSKSKVVKESDQRLDDFLTWSTNFHKTNGLHFPDSEAGDSWYKSVENAHKDIREKIGSVQLVCEVDLGDVQQPVDRAKIQGMIREIQLELPFVLTENELTIEDVLVPFLEKKKGISTAKFINRYAETVFNLFYDKNIPEECQELEVKIEKVKKITSNLGQEYAKTKTKNQKINMILSTDPKAFMQIGSYGCDNGSCFKQSGCNWHHKYKLGKFKDTFVLIIRDSEDGVDIYSDPEKNAARMWGWMDVKNNILNICNYYPKPGFWEGNAVQGVKSLAKILLDSNKVNLVESYIKIDQSVIYHNNKPTQKNWTFYTSDNKPELQGLIFTDAISSTVEHYDDDHDYDDDEEEDEDEF